MPSALFTLARETCRPRLRHEQFVTYFYVNRDTVFCVLFFLSCGAWIYDCTDCAAWYLKEKKEKVCHRKQQCLNRLVGDRGRYKRTTWQGAGRTRENDYHFVLGRVTYFFFFFFPLFFSISCLTVGSNSAVYVSTPNTS